METNIGALKVPERLYHDKVSLARIRGAGSTLNPRYRMILDHCLGTVRRSLTAKEEL